MTLRYLSGTKQASADVAGYSPYRISSKAAFLRYLSIYTFSDLKAHVRVTSLKVEPQHC